MSEPRSLADLYGRERGCAGTTETSFLFQTIGGAAETVESAAEVDAPSLSHVVHCNDSIRRGRDPRPPSRTDWREGSTECVGDLVDRVGDAIVIYYRVRLSWSICCEYERVQSADMCVSTAMSIQRSSWTRGMSICSRNRLSYSSVAGGRTSKTSRVPRHTIAIGVRWQIAGPSTQYCRRVTPRDRVHVDVWGVCTSPEQTLDSCSHPHFSDYG